MKYLKYYYIFNEANFSLDLNDDEKEFLNKVKKERPTEYSKYLTYIKNKGFWYAKQKYEDTDPINIKTKEGENRKKERNDIIKGNKAHVKNLIPNLHELDEIFESKFKEPFNNFWKYFYNKECPFDYFRKDRHQYENEWGDYILRSGGRYLNQKRASCECSNDCNEYVDNTPQSIYKFVSEYLKSNPNISLNKKLGSFHIGENIHQFQHFNSKFQMYIHVSRYAVSAEIWLNINFGISIPKYNSKIAVINKKAGNLQNGTSYENSPEITREDVIKCINDVFDMVIVDMDKKKGSAKKNMDNIIMNLISQALLFPEFLKFSKKDTLLHKKILELTDDIKGIDNAINMDDRGFND